MSWTTIDSRRHLSAADQAMATRLAEALQAADRIQLELPALLHLMRDHQAGQPRAAATDGDRTGPQPWCWEHERTVVECYAAGLRLCDGEAVAAASDPTGTAAVTADRAANDQRELRRLVELLVRTVDRMHLLANAYPTQPALPVEAEATPGEDWCRSCWKDHRYCEPVSLRPDGTARYRGLCRWCGDFRANHGFEPPQVLLAAKHRGERITQGMVDQVVAEHRKANPPKGKVRGKKRSVRR